MELPLAPQLPLTAACESGRADLRVRPTGVALAPDGPRLDQTATTPTSLSVLIRHPGTGFSFEAVAPPSAAKMPSDTPIPVDVDQKHGLVVPAWGSRTASEDSLHVEVRLWSPNGSIRGVPSIAGRARVPRDLIAQLLRGERGAFAVPVTTAAAGGRARRVTATVVLEVALEYPGVIGEAQYPAPEQAAAEETAAAGHRRPVAIAPEETVSPRTTRHLTLGQRCPPAVLVGQTKAREAALASGVDIYRVPPTGGGIIYYSARDPCHMQHARVVLSEFYARRARVRAGLAPARARARALAHGAVARRALNMVVAAGAAARRARHKEMAKELAHAAAASVNGRAAAEAAAATGPAPRGRHPLRSLAGIVRTAASYLRSYVPRAGPEHPDLTRFRVLRRLARAAAKALPGFQKRAACRRARENRSHGWASGLAHACAVEWTEHWEGRNARHRRDAALLAAAAADAVEERTFEKRNVAAALGHPCSALPRGVDHARPLRHPLPPATRLRAPPDIPQTPGGVRYVTETTAHRERVRRKINRHLALQMAERCPACSCPEWISARTHGLEPFGHASLRELRFWALRAVIARECADFVNSGGLRPTGQQPVQVAGVEVPVEGRDVGPEAAAQAAALEMQLPAGVTPLEQLPRRPRPFGQARRAPSRGRLLRRLLLESELERLHHSPTALRSRVRHAAHTGASRTRALVLSTPQEIAGPVERAVRVTTATPAAAAGAARRAEFAVRRAIEGNQVHRVGPVTDISTAPVAPPAPAPALPKQPETELTMRAKIVAGVQYAVHCIMRALYGIVPLRGLRRHRNHAAHVPMDVAALHAGVGHMLAQSAAEAEAPSSPNLVRVTTASPAAAAGAARRAEFAVRRAIEGNQVHRVGPVTDISTAPVAPPALPPSRSWRSRMSLKAARFPGRHRMPQQHRRVSEDQYVPEEA